MNIYDYENTAAYNRQQIQDDIKLIQFEKTALKARAYTPGRFTRLMFNFANWMIATGKQLRVRYEIPVANCNQVKPKSFAH
jgi:hypothetical protein